MIQISIVRLATIGVMYGVMSFTLAACDQDATKPPAPRAMSPAVQAAATTPPVADAYAPIAALNDMDNRTPVPLQPMMAWHQKQNMQQHLVAIQRIIDGLAREDWNEIAAASALIESSPQMQQMCEHMGAGAEGFTERALDFHKRADTIGIAAKAEDGPGVLRATSNTLKACTGCHAAYRQDVVTAETWQKRTGSDHDPSAMHDMR
jgi:hypothetical protein